MWYFLACHIASSASNWHNVVSTSEMIVCNMAGTVAEDRCLVYLAVREALSQQGIHITNDDVKGWHGAGGEEAIRHFVSIYSAPSHVVRVLKSALHTFRRLIKETYFGDAAVVKVHKGLKNWIRGVQAARVKVCLDTSHQADVQLRLVKRMGIEVDACVSASDVSVGKPAPYMIFHAMEKLGVKDVRKVVKIGDTVRDIQMGRNAGCGLVVGVLGGADSYEALMEAGADIVVERVTDLSLPKIPVTTTP